MTLPAAIDPERVVVEVASLEHAAAPWRWFEIDLDRLDAAALRRDRPTGVARASVSAMTRAADPALIAALLARPRSRDITHLQFEVHHLRPAVQAAALICAAGLIPLPALHLRRPPTGPDTLRRAVDRLACLGAPLIKLAYPAPDAAHVDDGIALLTTVSGPGLELALIPMGTRTGRAAANTAGSRLIWAPPHADRERWGADQLQSRLLRSRPSPLGRTS